MSPLAVLSPTPTEQAEAVSMMPTANAANQRNLEWLKRSISSRTEAQVTHEVEKLTTGVRIFANPTKVARDEIPILSRTEVQTSFLLGQGAFSEVHAVRGFVLSDEKNSSQDSSQDPFQEQARAQLIQSSKRKYVMKHLRRDLLITTSRKQFCHAAADLVLESKFLSCLDHPNILALRGTATGPSAYGNGSHDGFFLILDRLDETLSQRINRWRSEAPNTPTASSTTSTSGACLSVYREKLEYARQIASALDYLHQNQIIYRDLKPDNCGFIDNKIKIFDFGLCRELEEEHPTEDQVFHMSGVGTRRYMSPEVFLGRHYNCKADIYSWTVVLYTMISLQKPFEQLTADMHRFLVCQEGLRPSLVASWPEEIRQLFQEGWAANPQDRPTAKQLVHKVQSILDLADGPRHQQDDTSFFTNSGASSSSAMETSINNLMESILPQCRGVQFQHTAGKILRLLETQIVAGATSNIQSHQTSYPHLQHLRSAYL